MNAEFASLHRKYMGEALREARSALDAGDVPVGAVVVCDGKIIGRGHNQRELLHDPTAHAEMIAITAAASEKSDWRLEDCEIYVTLEPCPMCASAIQQARIKTLVYGAFDRGMGACDSDLHLVTNAKFGRVVEVIAPVMEEECAELLLEFFSKARKDRG
ncbi:MAG: nucleoside deaminase [Candidatus Brocadiia bacterium]